MIKSLKIENFKSIKSLEIPCKKINIFIGKPNTGKSNILEALGLISYVLIGSEFNFYFPLKDFVRFQYIQDIFNDKDTSNEVKINIDNEEFIVRLIAQTEFGIYLNRTNLKDSPSYTLFKLKYDGELDRSSYLDARSILDFLKIKFYRFKPLADLDNIDIKFKSIPGNLLPPNGVNLVSTLRTNPDLFKIAKEALEEFGIKMALKEEEGRIDLLKEIYGRGYISFDYNMLSDTIQRFLFFISAMKSNKDSVLVFEEPEAHSFPYYTKILAEAITYDRSNNQYFISTHNPYFLLPLLETAPENDVAIFNVNLKDYRTIIKELTTEEKNKILEKEIDAFLQLI